jgi:aspartate kinase
MVSSMSQSVGDGHVRAPARRAIIVQKYGGSSVADVERLGRVADRVVAAHHAGYDVVAVVSAMGKTTDGLLALAREVAEGVGRPIDPPRRELDMLVSTGERVATSLLSIAIKARGCEAISFTGSQCGILTNDRHFDARIIEVRPHRIEDELARGKIVIVAGYQGMSYRREITTLGRGGTDTTAVALAAALHAERCEIYSDVDGVYTADPRAVASAEHLPLLDYDMLEEMAHAGAKVLCAQAIEWARRAGIAIHARSTFDLKPAARETVVRKLEAHEVVRARAVTCDSKIALLEVAGVGPEALLERLAALRLPIAELRRGGDGAEVVVSLLSAPDWAEARRELAGMLGVTVHDAVVRISLVGSDLGGEGGLVGQFWRMVAAAAPPRAFSATAMRLSAILDAERAHGLERAIHQALVATPTAS